MLMILILLYLIIFLFFYIIYSIIRMIYFVSYRYKVNHLLFNIKTKAQLVFLRTKDFESIIAEIYKRNGYKVKITNSFGDGHNGLILNDVQYVLIKKYSLNYYVEIEDAKKLVKDMNNNSIYRGIFITTGDFKLNTLNFCHSNVIKCINGDQLLQMILEIQRVNQRVAEAAHDIQ